MSIDFCGRGSKPDEPLRADAYWDITTNGGLQYPETIISKQLTLFKRWFPMKNN